MNGYMDLEDLAWSAVSNGLSYHQVLDDVPRGMEREFKDIYDEVYTRHLGDKQVAREEDAYTMRHGKLRKRQRFPDYHGYGAGANWDGMDDEDFLDTSSSIDRFDRMVWGNRQGRGRSNTTSTSTYWSGYGLGGDRDLRFPSSRLDEVLAWLDAEEGRMKQEEQAKQGFSLSASASEDKSGFSLAASASGEEHVFSLTPVKENIFNLSPKRRLTASERMFYSLEDVWPWLTAKQKRTIGDWADMLQVWSPNATMEFLRMPDRIGESVRLKMGEDFIVVKPNGTHHKLKRDPR